MGSDATIMVFDHHNHPFGADGVLFWRNDQVNIVFLIFIDHFI